MSPRKPGNRQAATHLIRISTDVRDILQLETSSTRTYDDVLRGILADAGYDIATDHRSEDIMDSPPSGEE